MRFFCKKFFPIRYDNFCHPSWPSSSNLKRKGALPWGNEPFLEVPAMTYFPASSSIIGAEELDDRVRNGIGYGLFARITRNKGGFWVHIWLWTLWLPSESPGTKDGFCAQLGHTEVFQRAVSWRRHSRSYIIKLTFVSYLKYPTTG